tara:strand:+ start:730 stop:1044 length:315 start_codon:yes stop_codon:yes gene_type:complete
MYDMIPPFHYYNNKYNIEKLFSELIVVNKKPWNIEDSIRIKEKNQEFDDEFIQIARSVYFINDDRARIKNDINDLTESNIFEVKSYEKYVINVCVFKSNFFNII